MNHWTAADQAELDVLLWELVTIFRRHRLHCTECLLGRSFCDPMRACVEIVIDWRERRLLRSKADWLRAHLGEVRPLHSLNGGAA